MPVILVTESLSNRNEIYIIYNKFWAKCFTGNELLKSPYNSRATIRNRKSEVGQTSLSIILNFQAAAVTEREKGEL